MRSPRIAAVLLAVPLVVGAQEDRRYLPPPTTASLTPAVLLYDVTAGTARRVDTLSRERSGAGWTVRVRSAVAPMELRFDSLFRASFYAYGATDEAIERTFDPDSAGTARLHPAILALLETLGTLPARYFGTYLIDPRTLARESRELRMAGVETVTVSAGTMATYRVEEPDGSVFWLREQAPHIVVKADLAPGRTLGGGARVEKGSRTVYALRPTRP